MKERPILFSGAMVRALLDGRKTQTRRVVKPQPPGGTAYVIVDEDPFGKGALCINSLGVDGRGGPIPGEIDAWRTCPYGTIGDRLWVRETFFDNNPGERDMEQVYYRADGEPDFDGESITRDGPGWTPSIHMPRWASRLTLEITGVRVERVQDISEADAWAEGYDEFDGVCGTCRGSGTHPYGYPCRCEAGRQLRSQTALEWYRDLWDSINGKRPGCSWEANPWVWVLEFRRVEAPDA